VLSGKLSPYPQDIKGRFISKEVHNEFYWGLMVLEADDDDDEVNL
jgi:hypothetical protein